MIGPHVHMNKYVNIYGSDKIRCEKEFVGFDLNDSIYNVYDDEDHHGDDEPKINGSRLKKREKRGARV